MILLKPGSQEFLSWELDDQTPVVLSQLNLPSSMNRAASASQNGRIFFMKRKIAYTIVNNNLIQLKDFDIDLQHGCAAFEPGNDDAVYIIGGADASNNYEFKKTVYKYQFSTNEYTNLEKDMPVNGGIRRHSCVGVETTNGDKVFKITYDYR